LLTESFNQTIDYITSKGAFAMLQPHNYGRFNGAIITDVPAFGAWWTKVAAVYKANANVIFDINNEFHDMPQDLVVQLNQAGIDGIRNAGATQQIITPEGNAWTGAWSWVTNKDQATGTSNADTMANLTDPSDKLVYQMHQYLDTDGSGTSEDCVSSTIGAERLRDATAWLKANGKKGLIGEFAAGDNAQCKTAIRGLLQVLNDNNDVWTGYLWWAAGPWWADYMYSMEPGSGVAFEGYADLLMEYA